MLAYNNCLCKTNLFSKGATSKLTYGSSILLKVSEAIEKILKLFLVPCFSKYNLTTGGLTTTCFKLGLPITNTSCKTFQELYCIFIDYTVSIKGYRTHNIINHNRK